MFGRPSRLLRCASIVLPRRREAAPRSEPVAYSFATSPMSIPSASILPRSAWTRRRTGRLRCSLTLRLHRRGRWFSAVEPDAESQCFGRIANGSASTTATSAAGARSWRASTLGVNMRRRQERVVADCPYFWRAASPEVPTIAPIEAQEWPSMRACVTATSNARSASARPRKASRTARSATASLLASVGSCRSKRAASSSAWSRISCAVRGMAFTSDISVEQTWRG